MDRETLAIRDRVLGPHHPGAPSGAEPMVFCSRPIQGVALEDFLDFPGPVLAHFVKLTASLVVTSEFLRVILVYELSREVCRPSGGHFRRCRFFDKKSWG